MPKKAGSACLDSSSVTAAPGENPGVACTIPSLVSSRQIARHPRTFAILRASVVCPSPEDR